MKKLGAAALLLGLVLTFFFYRRSALRSAVVRNPAPSAPEAKSPVTLRLPKAPDRAPAALPPRDHQKFLQSLVSRLPRTLRGRGRFVVHEDSAQGLAVHLELDRIPVERSELRFGRLPDGSYQERSGFLPTLIGAEQMHFPAYDAATLRAQVSEKLKGAGQEAKEVQIEGPRWKVEANQRLTAVIAVDVDYLTTKKGWARESWDLDLTSGRVLARGSRLRN